MMQGYFLNAELKRSSVILVSLMVVFLLMTIGFLEYHHNQLKADYIELLGGVASRVIEWDPELEGQVIPLLTQEMTPERKRKGRELLFQYGLSPRLENTLFPYLKRTFWENTVFFVILFLLGLTLLFILNYAQYAFFYKRVRRITQGARRIIEGDYEIALDEEEEGDLSKLANAFNSMKGVILNQLNRLQKEKEFLVELMSDISHQLKTPLSSLIVYNDILLHKNLTPEQRETFLQKEQDQLKRMKWLIYSILKLAKLDAHSIEFDQDEESLNETIHNAIDALESKAVTEQVMIHFLEEQEVFFTHDRLWLEEALINILKNGLEHTSADGQIVVELIENSLYRQIVIEDTGEGIVASELPKIFKRFYKVHGSRKSESLGIGLALAKSIIEAHGGVIEVQSEPGQGTRFMITFLK